MRPFGLEKKYKFSGGHTTFKLRTTSNSACLQQPQTRHNKIIQGTKYLYQKQETVSPENTLSSGLHNGIELSKNIQQNEISVRNTYSNISNL